MVAYFELFSVRSCQSCPALPVFNSLQCSMELLKFYMVNHLVCSECTPSYLSVLSMLAFKN